MNTRQSSIAAASLGFVTAVIIDVVAYLHHEPTYWLIGAACFFMAGAMFGCAAQPPRRR